MIQILLEFVGKDDCGRNPALTAYQGLVAQIDGEIVRLEKRHRRDLVCKRGCTPCCRVQRSVLAVEAAVLLRAMQSNSIRIGGRRRSEDRCALLVGDSCAVYRERPLICRTHGLPLIVETDEETGISYCELNFRGRSRSKVFQEDEVLDTRSMNRALMEINRSFIQTIEAGSIGTIDTRIPLMALLESVGFGFSAAEAGDEALKRMETGRRVIVTRGGLMLLIFIFGVWHPVTAMAGSPPKEYRWKRDRDPALLAAGAGVVSLGLILMNGVNPPDPADLRVENIPGWDRVAVGKESHTASLLSDLALVSCGLMPLAAMITAPNEQRAVYGVMAAESVMWTAGVTFVVKSLARRARPYAYDPDRNESLDRDAAFSFFSGHTALAFQGAVLAAILLYSGDDSGALRRRAGYAGIGMAGLAGLFRVLSGNHFPSDVVAGAAAGTLIGWAVSAIHVSERPIVLQPAAAQNGIRVQLILAL